MRRGLGVEQLTLNAVTVIAAVMVTGVVRPDGRRALGGFTYNGCTVETFWQCCGQATGSAGAEASYRAATVFALLLF